MNEMTEADCPDCGHPRSDHDAYHHCRLCPGDPCRAPDWYIHQPLLERVRNLSNDHVAELTRRIHDLRVIVENALGATTLATGVQENPSLTLARWKDVNAYLEQARDAVEDMRFIVRAQLRYLSK